MPVTAVADITGVPKVGITVSSPDGSAITAVSLTRTVAGATGSSPQTLSELVEIISVMARWDFYYGGQLLVSGLNDKAREQLQTAISEVLVAGNRAWFTASDPGGPGAFSIYLQPGVAFAFTSDDAPQEDFAEGDDPLVVYGRSDS